jgi:hypothetical protein
MADLPSFLHIHCSSRFDRSAASLEYDLDNWMADASIITLTEVNNDARAAKLREKGWSYFNAKSGGGRDDGAIAWETATWRRSAGVILKLTDHTFDRWYGAQNTNLWACTVVLNHVLSGHKLLVSVTHMPAHVEGAGGWRDDVSGWQARKRAYLNALTNWSTHVADMTTKQKIDAQLICGDWNVSFKADWFRQILGNHWGADYDLAWKTMPTDGGSLHSDKPGPAGVPGKSYKDRIIDGSLYNGLKVTKDPVLMPRVSSSDHRPYKETFQFDFFAGHAPKAKAKAKKTVEVGSNASVDVPGYGDVFHGEAWWGFGDYMDDEAFFTPAQEPSTGEAGGEVL